MIRISGQNMTIEELPFDFPQDSIEYKCLVIMGDSSYTYSFANTDELRFLILMRGAIVRRSRLLNRSGLAFAVFRKTFCNEEYWKRNPDGGFQLLPNASAVAAIEDIYKNGRKYGTECATAMLIVYYGALVDIVPKEKFDRQFRGIILMNWKDISAPLRETGYMNQANNYFPGDRRYFANPDVDIDTPHWQGENVIDLGDGTWYGHGIGIQTGERIIASLNRNRGPNATRSAYLMSTVGLPNFNKLYRLFRD